MNYKPYRNEETRSSVLNGVLDKDNQAAWERFFDTYAGYVFAIARNAGLPAYAADEIVQCVMLGIVRNEGVSKYDKSLGSFRGWLTRLVKWRIADYLRKVKAERTELLTPTQINAIEDNNSAQTEAMFESEWLSAVMIESLRRLRQEVNPQHFGIFHSSMIEELDTGAITKLYHVSRDNIYQIRRRVNARFREIITEVRRELE